MNNVTYSKSYVTHFFCWMIIFVMSGKIIFVKNIHNKMTAIKSLINKAKSFDSSNENQDLIAIRTSNARCQKEVAMSNSEIRNQIEQQYYNKASGCSVRAQVDNLFDYNVE